MSDFNDLSKAPKKMTSKLRLFVPYLFLVAVALWSVWPVAAKIKSSLPIGHEDVLLTWIINENIEKIPNDIPNLFNGNIFFPYKNTMAYSDLFLPSSLISFFPVKMLGSYLVAFNFSLILGQILTALVVYLWFKELTKDTSASILGSVAFIFSQIRMHYYVHIHTFIFQWLFLSFFFLWKYTKDNKPWRLYAASIFLILQFWESPLPVFWIFSFAAILLLPKFDKLKQNLKHILLASAMVIFATLPLINAYYSVSNQFNYVRSIREAAHFALSPDSLITTFFSPGLFVLSVISIVFLVKNKFNKKDIELKWILPLFSIGLIMALGPVLKWQGGTVKLFGNIFIPLPYGIFYYVIPGFGALRTPSRWLILFAFSLSALIALALSKYRGKYKRFLFLLGLMLAIFGGTRIQKVTPIPNTDNYPPVYKWLKDAEGDAVLELPIYTSADGSKYPLEFYRMLYSLYHKKNLVNGASGFDPPPWQNLVKDISEVFPDSILEKRLRETGVDYVIVHKNQYGIEKLKELSIWVEKRVVYEDKNTQVIKL
ncbi:hypothetical protein A2962_02965 [Candidatus Woesebacteria bacterium RIFCSPLOWO2_01_FULL_39_61]|nr:MAG: hypothetical protein A2962_02965 [Candidatus Woesebacteria bacterium RIFCSPLOWO2_01_FULL_39_61]